MEQWKEVQNTNGKILISSTGRIKSLLRDDTGRILKPQLDHKGYRRISVTIDGHKMTYKVHRLVAQAFIPNTDNKPQVNHIDGNKNNNAVENLEWVTNQENCNHAINAGLWDSVIAGSRAENAKRMKKIKAIDINTGDVKVFNSISSAEHYFNSRHICDVLKGKRSKCKGHRFIYAEGSDADCQH
jgi:hypothetical protein